MLSLHHFFFFIMLRQTPSSTPFPYTTLFRSWLTVYDGSTFLSAAAATGFVAITNTALTNVDTALTGVITVPSVAIASRRSEEQSELQSPVHLVCRLLLEKKIHAKLFKATPYH